MAKPIGEVAGEIQDAVRKQGVEVLTITWPRFYELADRERMKVEFQEQLRSELEKKSLLISYGNAVVVVAKDYDFSPLK